MAPLQDVPLPPQGSTSWYAHYTAMDGSLRNLEARGVPLETFAGSTDDAKLDAAFTWCAAQTYPPPILLGPKAYTFTKGRTTFDGLGLIGVEGMGNAEKGNQASLRTRVNLNGGNTWLLGNGGAKASENWNITIRNLAFVSGNESTSFASGSAAWVCCNFRDCSWSGFKNVFGDNGTQMLVRLSLMDGWLSFNNGLQTAIHLGGSDNSLFQGMTNIDSPTGNQRTLGTPHVRFSWLDKSDVGPVYITAEGNWLGIKVAGQSGTGSEGSVGIYGAKIEGRNAGQPSNGALIRVEGGDLRLRDCWLGFGMANPSAPGRGDQGIVHQTEGKLLMAGCTYGRANGVAETVPLLYNAGGEAQIVNQYRGGSWTGRPKATGAGIFIRDASTST